MVEWVADEVGDGVEPVEVEDGEGHGRVPLVRSKKVNGVSVKDALRGGKHGRSNQAIRHWWVSQGSKE